MIEIPLTNSSAQSFSVVINGESYDALVTFNSRHATWSLSLSQSGVNIVAGVYLVGGIDTFKQYVLVVRNVYVVNLENPSADPNRDDFGITSRLFVLTDDEVEELNDSDQTI